MSGGWTIQTLVQELADQGEKPCLISIEGDAIRQISCANLASQVSALAWGLRESGLGPGDTVGLIAPNGPDWVIARLALGCTGALVHTLDDLTSESELKIALAEARCSRVLTSAAHAAQLREIDPACQLVVLDDSPVPGTTAWRSLFLSRADALPPVDADAPAMLVYTSGTTGRPKAFLLTSSQLWANVAALSASGLVKSGDRVLLPLPLHHVYPFTVGILTVLSSGAIVVFPEEVGGPQILRALSLAKVSIIIGVPRLYAALVSGLNAKLAASGGLSAAIFHYAARCQYLVPSASGPECRPLAFGFGAQAFRTAASLAGLRRRPPATRSALAADRSWVRHAHGLWPCGDGIDFHRQSAEHTRLGSEGKAFCGEIRIVPVDETAEGGDGEIQLRGPTVFSGYRNNDEANRQSFTTDGWFRTGDIGHLDADGFLFVTGRIKEMLILGGGKKVLPEDLEKHYASRFFKEIAILERDGALVALVLPDLEAIRGSGSPRVEEVIRVTLSECAMKLPSYERIAGYRLVREPLPKTRLHKYQRFRLPALYEAAETRRTDAPHLARSPEDEALLNSEPARTIFGILKSRYAGKPVSLDASPMLDLGIDSLEWIGLALVLEQQAGVYLDEGVAGESLTVRDLLLHAAMMPEGRIGGEYDEAVRRWLAPAGPMLRVVAKLLYRLNAFLMPALFHLRVTGRENLPGERPLRRRSQSRERS